MDKVSFNKLLDCLDYHGIYSFETLIMSHEHEFSSAYTVNGQLLYLDSWITENISSICRFAIKCVQEFNLLPENDDWLSIKSIRDLEKTWIQDKFTSSCKSQKGFSS